MSTDRKIEIAIVVLVTAHGGCGGASEAQQCAPAGLALIVPLTIGLTFGGALPAASALPRHARIWI